MSNTYNLFSVNVFHGKIIIPVNIHKNILNFVEKNYEEKNTISCVNGFQYHEDFNGKKELNKIINKPHCHSSDNTVMAAVLYLSNENNNITFTRCGEVFEIKPKLFDYLIFPENLLHYVLPEQRTEKRICYAFNLKQI